MIIPVIFFTFALTFTNGFNLGIFSKGRSHLQRQKTPFSLEEALYFYKAKSFDGSWISDTELQFRDSNSGDYIIYTVDTGKFDLYFDYNCLENITSVYDVSFSDDRNYALVAYNHKQIYRHSASAQYKIVSIKDCTFVDVANSSYLQLAKWAPKGRGIAYVLDNDLYYVVSFDEKGETSVQVSTTGIPGVIYNGLADWVYEEEILGVSEAFSFSPDGKYLYYTTFNDSNVPEFQYPYYGPPGIDTQYPEILKIRYPKSGAENPTFSQHLISTAGKNGIEELQFPISKSQSLDIFLNQKWANNDVLSFSFANRVQNETITYLCPANSPGSCNEIYEEKIKNGWANVVNHPLVDQKAEKFLKIEAKPNDDGTSFPHLKIINIGGESNFLTEGQFNVLEIIDWDQDNQIIYFSATEENDPASRQVYSVKEDGSNLYCLSCQINSPEKNFCESASAKFSKKFSYVVLTCSGPDPLISYLYPNKIPLENAIALLEDNQNLRKRLENKLRPGRLDLRVPVPGGFQAEARLLLPPNLDTSGNTKYPLITYVYAGPESKQISNGYDVSYNAYLTTNLNIIIALIDGRGSANKEQEMMFATYRNLGSGEIEDQIQVTKYLQNKFPFIDANRSGIWGWSYGGYSTAKALETDTENVFQCGISVAPVTSWLLYDSFYTERYMGLPTEEDNLSGYTTSNVYNVTNLKKKQYYLIHGSGDDNVHYQQSMMLSKILEVNDVLFQQQTYPDEDHSLGGVTLHLYHSMVAFWKKCFNLR